MINNVLYLNNFQLNEMVVGSLIFVLLYIVYCFITKTLSIFDTIYCLIAFIIMYYISNIGYNFVVYYV
jgi:hypothetical protein